MEEQVNKVGKEMYELIKRIWEVEETPTQWSRAIIFPIYKKGNKLIRHNAVIIKGYHS